MSGDGLVNIVVPVGKPAGETSSSFTDVHVHLTTLIARAAVNEVRGSARKIMSDIVARFTARNNRVGTKETACILMGAWATTFFYEHLSRLVESRSCIYI